MTKESSKVILLQTPVKKQVVIHASTTSTSITSPEIYLPGMTDPSQKKKKRNHHQYSSSSASSSSSSTHTHNHTNQVVDNESVNTGATYTTNQSSTYTKRIVLGTSARKSARTFITRQQHQHPEEEYNNYSYNQENIVPMDNNRRVIQEDIQQEQRRPVKELKSWLMDFEQKQKTPVKPLGLNQRIGNSNGLLASKKVPPVVPRRSPKALVNEERKSVNELKGWLVGFEEKQKQQQKNQPVSALPVPTSMIASVSKKPVSCSTPLKHTSATATATEVSKCWSSAMKHDSSKSAKTAKPVSFVAPVVQRPTKISKTDVQATDQGYASVSKVSAWLANDAFNTQKEKIVRKDPNVYRKGLKFGEFKPSCDLTIENSKKTFVNEIASAEQRVSDRAQWLKNGAFNGKQLASTETLNIAAAAEPINVKLKLKNVQSEAFKSVVSSRSLSQGNEDIHAETNISDKIPSFKERRQLLIERELQAAKKCSEKIPAYKVKWENNGSTGLYAKKVVNKVGVAPKKSLSDLP